jgi:acetyltransferase
LPDLRVGAEYLQLGDGRCLVIRPIEPGDAPAWLAFLRGLSWATRYLRGARRAEDLGAEEIRRATAPDPKQELALVAAVEGRAKLAGVARLVLHPGGKSGELMLVVADDWQHCGVGHRLLATLLALAEQHGVGEIEANVLATNRGMLELLDEQGFVAEPQRPGEVTVRAVRPLACRAPG